MIIDDKINTYEIDKYISKSAPNAAEKIEEKQPPAGQKAEGKNPTEQDTVVNLSQASKEAQSINKVLSSVPDVRAEKVAEFKEKIESGDYQINHQGVADKLVDSFIDEIF